MWEYRHVSEKTHKCGKKAGVLCKWFVCSTMRESQQATGEAEMTGQCQDKSLGYADCISRVRQGTLNPKEICEPCCKRYDLDYSTEPTAQQVRLATLYDGARLE